MKTRVPVYDYNVLPVDVVTEQMGGAGDAAKAAGLQDQAKALGALSSQKTQRINQEQQNISRQNANLAQRLSDFNNYLNMGLNTSVAAFQQYAKQQGIEEANSYLNDRQAEIVKVQNNDKLTAEEKILRINDIRFGLKEKYDSIYGTAYNTTVKADFNNEVQLNAAKMAMWVKEMSGDDPETFKKNWRTYTADALKIAPDDASKLIQQRAYDRTGMQVYQTLYRSKMAQLKKQGESNYKVAVKDLHNAYINYLQMGDIGKADEVKAQYEKVIDIRVASGKLTEDEAASKKRQFATEGFIAKNRWDFDQALDEGKAPEFYTAFLKKVGTKDFLVYDPRKIQAHRTYMEKALETEFDAVADRIEKSLEEGVQPPMEELKRLDKYKMWGDADRINALSVKLASATVVKETKNLPLSEQIQNVEPPRDGDTPEEIAVKKQIMKDVEKRKTEAAKDPIGLLYKEGFVSNPVTLNFKDAMDPKNMDEFLKKLDIRSRHVAIANAKYDTTKPLFFTENEMQTFKSILEGDSPATQKLAIIKSILSLPNGVQKIAFNQIDKKLGLAGEVSRLIIDGRDSTAALVLDGNNLIKQPQFQNIKKDLQTEVVSNIPVPIALSPKNAEKSVNAVMSVYAQLSLNKARADISEYKTPEEIDKDLLNEAINMVFGPKTSDGYFAPYGVDGDDFDDWVDYIRGDNVWDDNAQTLPPIMNSSDTDTIQAVLSNSYPVRISGNKYKFIYRGKQLQTPEGETYILEYKKVD